MKRLILLCGANGIGKSTASAELMKRLPHSSYIDSDYCRMTNPPIFNEELIRLNYKNILAMMENSFACGEIQNVIFPFGFHGHRKQLFDVLLEELRQKGISFKLVPVLLYCGEEENGRRARADGRDEEDVYKRQGKGRAGRHSPVCLPGRFSDSRYEPMTPAEYRRQPCRWERRI